MLDLSHLSPAEFEELTYDLLREAGAHSMSWRKGTPLPGSSADAGRDIECSFAYPGPAGEALLELRFVQCKHFTRGVSPDHLASALAWASSVRPDALHLVVSGFLTNPAKDFLQSYRETNRPAFRIVVWENPDLEERLRSHPALRRKYRLEGDEPQVALMHPAHVRFTTSLPVLSLTKLLDLLESLSPKDRQSYTALVALAVVQPGVRKPQTGKESVAELYTKEVSYDTMKARLLSADSDPLLMVTALTTLMLGEAFNAGNYLRAPELRARYQDFIAFVSQRAQNGETDAGTAAEAIAHAQRSADTIEADLRAGYTRYLRFCDLILQPLVEYREPVVLPDWA